MRIGIIPSVLTTLFSNVATRHRAVLLEGPSGIGKSHVVYQAAVNIAEQLGVDSIPVVDIRLSQCDPSDLRGVPSTENGRTVWNVPAEFPDPEENPHGILFLDEISSAPPSVAAIAYQLVLDRAQGSYKLPDGWMIVAAGNRQSDRGVTFQIPAPLRNRMTNLDVDTVLEDFIEHGARNDLDPRVMAFVSDRADLLHKFTKEEYGKQFPSPRGWFALSDKLEMGFDSSIRLELMKGEVGHEAAVSFEQFMRVWETMPSLNAIFEKPDSVSVPDKLDVRYCVTMGLAARIDKKNFNNAWKFLKRMPKDLQTLAVKLAYSRDKSILQATMFHEWAVDNQSALKRVGK